MYLALTASMHLSNFYSVYCRGVRRFKIRAIRNPLQYVYLVVSEPLASFLFSDFIGERNLVPKV